MLTLLAHLLAASFSAQAIILDPTYHAADALGYQVVGEMEFARNSSRPPAKQVDENIEEIGELCPRTQAYDQRISRDARFVILAWSDREFPAPKSSTYPSTQIALAQQRARAVADLLRKRINAELNFELVNMASSQPHMVRVGRQAQVQQSNFDIKTAMKISGAAPTNELELGLFGEYAQRSKALIWVDCTESFGKRRSPGPGTMKLARADVRRGNLVP